ncbi:hypothetical protein LJC00_03530 [Dysgonomonas sp. OttesenSCG-928-M03]|nr:hypothetical protein [Dysgonomonas sp. OttesenSCG-928-M03]
MYQAGFQNWMVAQDRTGWMYFANSKGLLEFDGVYWTLYPVKNKVVRSLKIIDDIIYVGANSEFGFFEKGEDGQLEYHSLSEGLPAWGGDIWSITSIGDKIYFLADNTIFVYSLNNGATISIPTDVKIDYCSTAALDRLYIATTEGLFFWDEEKANLVFEKESESLIGEKIIGLREYENQLLVTTARAGIYLVDDKGCKKIQSVADEFIRRNQLFCSLVIDSKMVLGSVQNGAFIFDLKDPSYKEFFNLDNGLRNNTILSMLFDNGKNLWLGLDKGIAYIDLNSPIRPLFPVNSPIGTGYCSVIYNNELYLGTNQGLYKLDKDGSYRMIEDSEGQVWELKIINGELFSSGDNGVMVITPGRIYKIKVMGTWGVAKLSSNDNMLIAGTYSGFRLIDKVDGVWNNVRIVKGFTNSCRGFVEDEVNNVFWMTNAGSGVEKLTIDPETAKIINRKNYHLGSTFVGENTFFRKIYNNLVICSENGVFQYSRISDEFLHYPELEAVLEGQKYYDFLDTDKLGNIWFVSDKRLKMVPFENGNYTHNIIDWGLGDELIDSSESVMLLDSGSAIVSVDKAFLKIDIEKGYNNSRDVDVFIRKLVTTSNDSVINYNNRRGVVEIPYSRNSINIYFAATEYAYSSDVVYSYRLRGEDAKWSIPSSKTMKEYTNLDEGVYVFEVKAFVSGYESLGNVAEITFEILPPWYRSTWAYFIYTILFIASMFVLYRKTIKKQKLIIIQKGQELEAQTRQYEKERMLKDKEIYELQNENLRTNLSYKTQELTGYILNIIRKNEMLEDVKKEVLNISKALDESKQPGVIKQKVVRLTTQINNNIERDKDFEVFQSNFNLIHKDFFKLLEEKYPGLTRNDKILCAYLKMNLSSKEIAPLQNISVRGVEVNRYRLRKKMNLDRDINLTEFMQNLSDSFTEKKASESEMGV